MSNGSPPPPPPPPGPPPLPPSYSAGGAVPMAPQNGMGTWSLILGILGLLGCCSFIFSILAIVFGVQGRKKASQGLATNGGMATAGMVLGIIGVVIGVSWWIYSIARGGNGWSFNFNN